MPELFGDALISFSGMDKVADDARFGRCQFCFRDGQGRGAFGLVHQGTQHGGDLLRGAAGSKQKDTTVERGVIVGMDVMRQVPPAFHLGIEHRVVAAAHEVTEEIESRRLRVSGGDGWEGNLDPSHFGLEVKGRDPWGGL